MSDKKRKRKSKVPAEIPGGGGGGEISLDGEPVVKRRKGKPIPFDAKLFEKTPRAKGSEKDPPAVQKNVPVREDELPPDVDTYADMAAEEEAKAKKRMEEAPLVPEPAFDFLQPFNPRMIDGRLTQAWTTTIFGTHTPCCPLCCHLI